MRYEPKARRGFICAAALLIAAGCGGGSGDDQPECGNGVLDELETCDDGNQVDDDDCTSECELPCGDGRLQASEECDIAIPEGETGACPSDCDDGMVCTDDALVGEMCQARCEITDVDFFRDGDDCCPDISENNAFNDFDCEAECGNGVVEMGETCDTAISAGELGACPDAAACDDGIACTVDSVVVPDDNEPGDGACRAYCEYTENTTEADGDGCCPAGATEATDDDCSPDAQCGNGVVNGGVGETCDTAIAAGMNGACPTTCADPADACFDSLLVSAGTCEAECIQIEQTQPVNDDMCCPIFHGANNRNDNDCTSSCGTPAEECDTPGEGSCDTDCRIVRTGFRVIEITIQDPHIYWDADNGSCPDLTSVVNSNIIPDNIEQDEDGDGWADLTWLLSFIPLDQSEATNPVELVYANCLPSTDPSMTTCEADPLTDRVSTTANNMDTGECLGVVTDTLTDGYTAPDTPVGPCFVTDAINVDLQLGSLTVPLEDGYIAAEYDMDPATGLVTGLLRGFVSEAAAEAAMIPADIPLVGGSSLAEVLAGGLAPGSCNVTTDPDVPIGDDRDVGPDGTTMGWYFYVNFTAVQVPYDDKPNASN